MSERVTGKPIDFEIKDEDVKGANEGSGKTGQEAAPI